MRKRTRLAAWILIQLCLLELSCWGLGLFLQSKRKMFAPPADPEGRAADAYAVYLAQRDPLLGWPSPSEFPGQRFDASGARRLPGLPEAQVECVSMYGDSFTFGDEVDDAQAWGNLLACKLGCRVANYGVGGYGTDQAFLRYRRNAQDAAQVVILGHLSENVERNLSRDRDLLNFTRFHALKPRFVLADGGALQLVELPQLDEREYLRSVGLASPLLPVEHENFQPGGPAGATRLEFPFTLAILRNLGDFRMRAFLRRRPEYAEFYEPGHPLRGLQLTASILESFAREAQRRGQHPLILLLPTRPDVLEFRKHGRWTYAPLADELRARGLEFLDFGPPLDELVGARDAFEFFMPRAHYSPAVNARLADFVHERLARYEELRGRR